jgi:hypothetical protein
MAQFNVHELVVQAAIIEAAARLSAMRKATAEETAAIANAPLELFAKRPTEAEYAPVK